MQNWLITIFLSCVVVEHLNTFASISLVKISLIQRGTVFCYQNCSDLLWEKKKICKWLNIVHPKRRTLSSIISSNSIGDHPFRTSAIWRGKGQILLKFANRKLKTTADWVGRGQKSDKFFGRPKWMVPSSSSKKYLIKETSQSFVI